ncbi:MAG TPA: mandelate racemase/muconate lactonizing enzyme family protein [Rhodothermales bacterium]|nr:mandelate racemase/muconate lactonizing enzyme family protein [Rhodothermales bacterium]
MKTPKTNQFDPSSPSSQSSDRAVTEPAAPGSRRSFLRKAGIGGLSMAALVHAPLDDQIAFASQNVRRASSPSDLKITDMRVSNVGVVGNTPIIRIYTNQGLVGHGDVRDGADARYALFLKSRILGENPCNVEMLFKRVRQFGGQARQAGGVCAVEMALWDLAGKAYDVPVYQMLGGKYRDKIRIYVDTPRQATPEAFAVKMKERIDAGFTFLKMDFGIDMIKDEPGTLVGKNLWDPPLHQWDRTPGSYGMTRHPFTRIQITDKGLARISDYLAAVREAVGYEIPIASDHYGHFGVNDAIRLGKAVDPYRLAWLEDMVPWDYTDMWKEISLAIETPTMTGEDIYLLDYFKPLIDARAVDMIHPDPNSAGGILETKRIGDYAYEHGVAMAVHHAASPISFLGSVHCAAATENFVALEHHSVDNPWWEDLAKDVEKPIVQNGFVTVPESPGLGVDLNDEAVKEHLREGTELFAPTPEWDELRSWDRIWS